MNRRLFENILLTISITLSLIVILNYSISKIQNNDLTSKEMRDEIIRQLKEKEGMTIEDYLIKQYFERMMENME